MNNNDGEGGLPEELLVADAKHTSRDETLAVIETLTLQLVEAVAKGEDPTLFLVCDIYICM